MASLRIEFHPSAVDEAEGALEWYAARSPAAAKAYLHELDHALSQIAEAPHRWPRYSQDVRRYQFRRFPFTLFYRATQDSVQVLAVAHQRRKPGYWRHR